MYAGKRINCNRAVADKGPLKYTPCNPDLFRQKPGNDEPAEAALRQAEAEGEGGGNLLVRRRLSRAPGMDPVRSNALFRLDRSGAGSSGAPRRRAGKHLAPHCSHRRTNMSVFWKRLMAYLRLD